jgi:hypothetical protein
MKNKILALIVFASFQLVAQDFGKVVLRNANNTYPPFIVSINGVRISNDYSHSISFNYLDEQKYKIKLLQSGSSSMLYFNLTSDPKYISKYVVNRDNLGNYTLMLESKSLLSLEPEAGTNLGGGSTNNISITTTVPANSTNSVLSKGNNNINSNSNTIVASTPSVIPPPTISITAMDAADFNERLNAVKKEHFDRERMDKAKSVFDGENFSTSQVCTVMKVFSFDDARLNFAKYAWHNTIDKKNFYKAQDQLSFSSYKKELQEYTKKNP